MNADFPDELAEQLEDLKRRSQEAEEDFPRPGSLPVRCSLSSHMEQDGSGDGSCTRPASMWMWAWADSPTSSPRRGSPPHSCGSTRSGRRSRCSTAFSPTSSRSLSPFRSVRSTSVSMWQDGNSRSTKCPRSSPAVAARVYGWAPMPLMRSWTPAWKRRGPFIAPSEVRVQFAGRRLGDTRLQQRRAPCLLHLRQDGRDHGLAQGLDAGSLDEQWLGWRVSRHPRGVPLQTRVSPRDEGRRGVRLSRSDSQACGPTPPSNG